MIGEGGRPSAISAQQIDVSVPCSTVNLSWPQQNCENILYVRIIFPEYFWIFSFYVFLSHLQY